MVGTRDFQQDVIKIGRLATAHLKLEDTRVSRIHAVVEVTGGGRDVFITDMGSAEGTFVNGDKVNKVKLKDGDTVVLGDTRLVVSLGAGRAKAAAEVQDDEKTPSSGSAVRAPVARPAQPAPVAARPAAVQRPVAATTPASPAPVEMGGEPNAEAEDCFASSEETAVSPVPNLARRAMPVSTPPPVSAASVPVPAPAAQPAPRAAVVAEPLPASAPHQPPFAAHEEEYAEAEEDGEDGPWETEPEPVPDASNAVLEIQVRWGGTVLEVQHHPHTPLVTVGPGGHIHVSGQEFNGPPKPLFSCSNKHYALHIPSGFKGFIRTPSHGLRTFEQIKGERDESGKRVSLGPDESGELHYHDMTLAFRFNEPRTRVVPTIFGAMDYGWMNTFMTTVFLSAAFVATLVLYPQDTKSLEEDLFQTNNRFTQFIVNPEKKQKSEFLKKLEKAKNDKGPQVARAGGSSSARKDNSKDNKPPPRVPTKEEIRARNEAAVQKKIDAMFGGGGSGDVFSAANNETLNQAMGGVSSRNLASAFGMGGLGERGHGPGGTGTGTGTFGVGGIGTRGRGGGNAGYGSGTGGLGGKSDRAVDISPGAPVILGSLDKEIIRRVIKDNLAQIKYCYERELTTTPGLAGKVQVKFVIGAQGNIQNAVVAETSMNNKNVENCITSKVRSWVFPKPKGGGIVIVTYPFIFKQGG